MTAPRPGPPLASATGVVMTLPHRRLAGFLGLSLGLGLVAGVVWWRVTPLATYTVRADGAAGTTERGLTDFFAGDAWFSVLGLAVGLVLGTLGWRWFGRLGWRVVLLVVLAGLVAAFGCLALGGLLGPGDFDERLAAAAPGAVVPIDLTLRTPATVLMWVVGAVAPVLVGSSLARDPEDLPGPEAAEGTPPTSRPETPET